MYAAVRELTAIAWGISLGLWMGGHIPGWSVLATLGICMLVNGRFESTSIWRG